jgi:hypothetical protein
MGVVADSKDSQTKKREGKRKEISQKRRKWRRKERK